MDNMPAAASAQDPRSAATAALEVITLLTHTIQPLDSLIRRDAWFGGLQRRRQQALALGGIPGAHAGGGD